MEGYGAKSESMELKLKELFKEVQLNYDSITLTNFIDETVSAIRDAIDTIPEDIKVGADIAPGFVRDVGADKVEFTFKKPNSIEIGGSYSTRSIAKPCTDVDVFVRMPKECFHEKDYLNHRYHAKRCLYLCVIKKYLSTSAGIKSIEWSTFLNEARKPVLVVYPVQELGELPGFFVRLIPTAPSMFNTLKLNLTRNNVRSLNQEKSAPQATPKYNGSILEDMFLEENMEFVRNVFFGWKELAEALILIKVWARHRGFIYAHDCFNGFLFSAVMSYLATDSGGKRINKSMKAMQIFRVTLDFIATSKLWEKGIPLQPQAQRSMLKEERMQYQQSFSILLFDSSGHHNLAFRITRSGFLELQEEATLTLNCINKCSDGGFEEAFMTKVDLPAKYDHHIRMNLKGNKEVSSSGFCLDNECWRMYEEKVRCLLDQGLGDRAKFIRVNWCRSSSHWNVEEGFSKFASDLLLVGILASSPETSFRLVDVGPSADKKDEAVKYRNFWGEKAELRRFKDGTIAESTLWECEQWERHVIIKRITEYVLLRHLHLSKENIVHAADQLDFSLFHGAGDPISFSGGLFVAFATLSKQLRSLKDIPLMVSSVQPLDSAFRFTSVFPPEPHPLADVKIVGRKSQKVTSTCVQPLEVMIQARHLILEGSGNWPMDDVAVEKTKSAFLLKIGESLQKSCGVACTASEEDVDVLMSGYAFRLKILHERGLGMLKKQVGNNRIKRITSKDKELFIRGQHSSMINGLQGRYPIYGPVVRLAKRWIASHLFSTSLGDEAVELLVAHLFLKPLPFYAPGSRITGFLRFLRLLSNFDWTFSPMIIDINSDLTEKDEKEITEKFLLSRKSFEGNVQHVEPAMYLATAYDTASEAWTLASPNTVELRRIMAYSRSSADFLTNLILQDQIESHGWERLFRTPLNNYDAIILLHNDKLPFPRRLLFRSEINQGRHIAQGDSSKEFHPCILSGDKCRGSEEMKNKLMVGFDPLRCFLEDLKREFPNKFKLWYDSLGGDTIGLTWVKPSSKKRAREEESEDIQNPIDVLRSAGELGKGFMRSIYLLKSPRHNS
ncbi:hypothetical protein GIB67_042777 [Kingdonia uniflora]|uniref:Nucleolar protein 6 n=1 Tax=Kingdonia uniflora TaxID=39325 RepID=A0A7J7L153_9MAGN|nr:hypothetical protein GIB67_042777 [Kingdonia uniflora]